MLFSSYVFILGFLPISLLGFFVSARLGHRAALIWLILASLFFYAWWNPSYLPLLLISIGFNYGLSELIGATGRHPRLQAGLLTGAIVTNLAALAYYKYLFAIVQALDTHAGFDLHFDDVILPIGISFFTFTQIGYLLDVKQGLAGERGFLNYAMFVTFFPHLIAGPILHNREMMPQYADRRTFRFSYANVSIGSAMFIMGLAKKTLLADPHSALVAQGFSHAGALSASDAWYAALSYSIQLYFDFSGYSDMAIGLARMFNIVFPVNFNSPFKSASVVEYWQRWHITLTKYITLYIYNPLAMWVSRRRMAKDLDISWRAYATLGGFSGMVLMPTFVTMGLAGIWHGAGAQFLIFGLLHATYISINHAWRVFRPKKTKGRGAVADPGWKRAIKILLTYLAVLVGAIFFRAPSPGVALDLLSGMIGLHSGPAEPLHSTAGIPKTELLMLVASYAIIWAFPNTQQILIDCKPVLEKVVAGPLAWLRWRSNLAWAVGLGALAVLAVLGTGGTTEFLYFQF